MAEAIAMSDRICVLSRRPACIKATYEIYLTVSGERTPLTSRKAPEFKDYFDALWKELDTSDGA